MNGGAATAAYSRRACIARRIRRDVASGVAPRAAIADGRARVVFSLLSSAENGYAGNLAIELTVCFGSHTALTLHYHAMTDAPTLCKSRTTVAEFVG